jgi:hypothetical protein
VESADDRKPKPRASLASLSLPANQIAAFLDSVLVRTLADTDAAVNVVGKKIFDKIRKSSLKYNRWGYGVNNFIPLTNRPW